MDKNLFIEKYYERKEEIIKFLIDIEKIIFSFNYPLEGNIFYKHGTTILCPEFEPKQVNLFWAGSTAQKNIMEIGFNASHSAFVMLLGNLFKNEKNNMNFTIFDINHHPYTEPSFEYLKEYFQHINFNFVKGDSKKELPKWIENNQNMVEQFDVIHVDGSHEDDSIKSDMLNVVKLVRVDGLIIVDDTDGEIINKYVDEYLSSGNFEEVDILETQLSKHRIIKKKNSIMIIFKNNLFF
jgi:hypothetical protein